MDAVHRAAQMMKTPMKGLPKKAVKYARYLGKKYRTCGEIFMTAFAHYAQYIESLPCEDSIYKINSEGKIWFASQQ